MLNTLLITLTQLKAGFNSEKVKIEIRQLLYSLCRSKRLPKTIYKSLISIIQNMETILKNTENSQTNESDKFRLNFADKFNLKDPNKNMALANVSFYSTWKT